MHQDINSNSNSRTVLGNKCVLDSSIVSDCNVYGCSWYSPTRYGNFIWLNCNDTFPQQYDEAHLSIDGTATYAVTFQGRPLFPQLVVKDLFIGNNQQGGMQQLIVRNASVVLNGQTSVVNTSGYLRLDLGPAQNILAGSSHIHIMSGGIIVWASGDIRDGGTLQLQQNATLRVFSGASNDQSSRVLSRLVLNNGTITFDDSSVVARMYLRSTRSAAIIKNYGKMQFVTGMRLIGDNAIHNFGEIEVDVGTSSGMVTFEAPLRSYGTVNVTSGTLRLAAESSLDSVYLGRESVLSVSTGLHSFNKTVHVENVMRIDGRCFFRNGIHSNGELQLQSGTITGNIESYGTLIWSDTVVVGSLHNQGLMQIHRSNEARRLIGDLTLTDTSKMIIVSDINHIKPFKVSGIADLHGILQIEEIATSTDTVLQPGSQIEIISADGGVTGQFLETVVDELNVTADCVLKLEYAARSVYLTCKQTVVTPLESTPPLSLPNVVPVVMFVLMGVCFVGAVVLLGLAYWYRRKDAAYTKMKEEVESVTAEMDEMD